MRSAIAKGRELPAWYLDEPTLLPGDEFYVFEFWTLHTSRPLGAGAYGPIPVPTIEDRAERRHGFDGDVFTLFVAVMRKMDEVFLDWMQEEHKRAEAARRRESQT